MTLGLFAISICANAEDWIPHYYEQPTPERFVGEVQAMSKAGVLADAKNAASIAAFLGRVMAANASQVEGWLNQLDGLKGPDKEALLLAANLSGTKEAMAYIQRQPDTEKYQKPTDIRSIEPNDGIVLDMLWGDFYASGDAKPIRRIVHALNYGKHAGALDKYKTSNKTEQDRNEAILESLFEAARWSLEANIRQHKRVAEIVEQIFWKEKITDEERTWLTVVLAKSLPEKYELTQVKPGEWAFRRKLHTFTQN